MSALNEHIIHQIYPAWYDILESQGFQVAQKEGVAVRCRGDLEIQLESSPHSWRFPITAKIRVRVRHKGWINTRLIDQELCFGLPQALEYLQKYLGK